MFYSLVELTFFMNYSNISKICCLGQPQRPGEERPSLPGNSIHFISFYLYTSGQPTPPPPGRVPGEHLQTVPPPGQPGKKTGVHKLLVSKQELILQKLCLKK
jgi:hypothetical protein